ncbi:MAG: hypothetical protein ABI863_22730 [Ginsengibacter sp.]
MQKFITVFAICMSTIVFLNSCHTAKEKQVVTEKTIEEAQPFFPVTEFLAGQLNGTDTLPITPVKITINENRRDSVWLKKEDIRKFASPFLHPVIDSIFMRNYFTGKSFMDQTINAVTFSFDAKTKLPDSIKLNHWDVYIDPQKSTVERIYLVKEDIRNGESVTTQLTWKVDKWCSIRTILQQPNKDPQVKEEIMKWNFDE